MNWRYYKKYINGKEVIGRCDVSPIFENEKVFQNIVKDLLKPFRDKKYDKIVALDSLGFILGSAMAYKTKKPLILIRKEKKLPYPKKYLLGKTFVDYTKKRKGFEIKKSSIKKGDKILLVDEWIETGTQMKAAINLIEKLSGKVVGISTINTDINKRTEVLFKKYNCKYLVFY